jgi:hypothetical protein
VLGWPKLTSVLPKEDVISLISVLPRDTIFSRVTSSPEESMILLDNLSSLLTATVETGDVGQLVRSSASSALCTSTYHVYSNCSHSS